MKKKYLSSNLLFLIIKHQVSLYFFLALIIFLFLLAKNPFSERTLIPNFEPFPDTFHYLTGARCLISGYGRTLCHEGKISPVIVPPLYSYILIPLLIFNSDPRVFYFINIPLAILSLFLFYLNLKKNIVNPLIIAFALLIYVTSFHLSWIVSLAMAENLLLPLFLLIFYLLQLSLNKKISFLIGLLSFSLFATKYIAAPLMIVMILFYLIKLYIYHQKLNHKKKLIFFIYFIVGLLISFFLLDGLSFFQKIIEVVNTFINKDHLDFSGQIYQQVNQERSWYSLSYLPTNLPWYIKSLIGLPVPMLWIYGSIIPSFISMGAFFAIILNVFQKKYRFLSLLMISLLIAQLVIISTFYSFESRYIFPLFPLLIFFFALFLQIIEQSALNKKFLMLIKPNFNILIILLIGLFFLTKVTFLKNQIMLNLKYTETPWYYLAIKDLNNFFSNQQSTHQPFLITAISPYLIDFYTNQHYSLLPLSEEQDFYQKASTVWGENYDYSNLINLYHSLLISGHELYLSNYALGREKAKHEDFQRIMASFDTELVQEGCYQLCNIYRIKLKEADNY